MAGHLILGRTCLAAVRSSMEWFQRGAGWILANCLPGVSAGASVEPDDRMGLWC
jgi:hypothetical protein